jgi:tripartite-type tricarboxylate transporter receptor subunit TctC
MMERRAGLAAIRLAAIRVGLIAGAIAGVIAAPVAAAAQAFPAKPIRMVVPFTPGSPVDVLARLAAQHAGTRLGQTIVIDNRPGAGTTLGTKAAAAADADGYTILIAATSFVISSVLYSNPGYDVRTSFAPVAMLARSPQMLVIAPDVPARTVAEFVAYAKAHPNKLNFGFGLGTLPQILGETFKSVTGTEIVSIPYKGGAQAITDMLGGRIQMNFGTPPTLLPLIQQGKIRALAVTTDTRLRELPDVPTMIESGLPQLALTFSAGVLAPTGTPEPVLDRLHAAFRDALASPDLAGSMAKLGFDPEPWTRQQYAAFLTDEITKWPPIVKASGIKAE